MVPSSPSPHTQGLETSASLEDPTHPITSLNLVVSLLNSQHNLDIPWLDQSLLKQTGRLAWQPVFFAIKHTDIVSSPCAYEKPRPQRYDGLASLLGWE